MLKLKKKRSFFFLNTVYFNWKTFNTWTLNEIFFQLKGKTYKWLFKKNYINLNLLSSNPVDFFISNKILIQKQLLTKKSIRFLSLRVFCIPKKKYKKYHIFTQTGLYVKPNIHFNKRGKISTYVLMLKSIFIILPIYLILLNLVSKNTLLNILKVVLQISLLLFFSNLLYFSNELNQVFSNNFILMFISSIELIFILLILTFLLKIMFKNPKILLLIDKNYKFLSSFTNSYYTNQNTSRLFVYKSLEFVKFSLNFFIDLKFILKLNLISNELNQNWVFFSTLSNYRLSLRPDYLIASWYERELNEFNNINFLNLKDTRNLLLPYNQLHNVSKKRDYNYKSFYPIISLKKKNIKYVFRYLITL